MKKLYTSPAGNGKHLRIQFEDELRTFMLLRY